MPKPKAAQSQHPKTATQWTLSKERDGSWKRCAVHRDGARVEVFDLKTMDPTVPLISAEWGAGVYRLNYLRADRKSAGSSPVVRIDAPGLEDRGCYPSDPARARAAAAEVAPAAAASFAAGMPAQVDMATFLTLWKIANGDAQARIAAHQADSDRRIQETSAFWLAQVSAARQLSTPTTDPALTATLAELTRRLGQIEDSIDDDDETPTEIVRPEAMMDPNVAAILQAVKENAPMVLAGLKEALAGKKGGE